MTIILWILITLSIISNLFLAIAYFILIKKVTPLSKKEKEFIEFAVNMYIKYAEELEITSPEQHEYIVKELEKIKKRYLNEQTENN
jgi:hypothetical protein